MTEEMENPPDTTYVLLIVVVCVVVAIAGTVIALLNAWPWFAYLLPLGIAGAFMVLIWWREYYNRPASVLVKDNGVVMRFRYSGDVTVPWSRVIGVGVNPGSSSNPKEIWDRNGALILDKGGVYQVTFDVATAVRSQYRLALGSYPREWDGYSSPRQFRKKAKF